MPFRSLVGLFIASLSLPAAALGQASRDDAEWDLGGFTRPITTSSEQAQLWFDRGLALCYGFNHADAITCFREALEADPHCAMAFWGVAYSAGPTFNDMEVDDDEQAAAMDALRQATECAPHASEVERALIAALTHRVGSDNPVERTAMDQAYSDAMRDVFRHFPDDVDVAALAAESMMVLAPWALWSPDGVPHSITAELIATLEHGAALEPDHPAICHFLIHTWEASPTPDRAAAAADHLRDRIPFSGHLCHMPSHIDIQLGHYHASNLANMKGIAADLSTARRTGRENFYALYRLHNYHFLVFGAMFDGRRSLALESSRELVQQIPPGMLAAMPDFLDAFVGTPYHVMVRFGMWDAIFAEPEPDKSLVFTAALRHYARGIAHAVCGELDEAAFEQLAFEAKRLAVPETRVLFNNTCADILTIAAAMLDGEIAYRRGDFDHAFGRLREAVRLDDRLNYDEPWGWMQPARHALGALLLEQGHVIEAEAVYRADLDRHPHNGWALRGLSTCLHERGELRMARRVEAQLEKAWERADIPLHASCFCAQAAMADR